MKEGAAILNVKEAPFERLQDPQSNLNNVMDLPTLSDAAPTIDTTNMPKTAPTTDIPTNQASVIPDDDDPTNFKASPRNHTSSSSFHDGSTQQQSANIETNDPFDNEKSSTEIDAERPHIAAATIVKIPA